MNRLTIFLLVCVPHFALGQEVHFRFPVEAASWTVTCQKVRQGSEPQAAPHPGEPGRPPEVRRVEVSQTDTIRRSLIYWSNGRVKEVWSSPKSSAIVTEQPNGETMVSTNNALYGDPFDASSFDWIKTAAPTSDKPVQYQGVECIHYAGAIDSSGLNSKQIISCQAWINAENLQPVALLKGDLLGKFAFGPPPDSSLVMPEKFKKRLDYYNLVMGTK